ncbi:hypothetical protein GCM10023094_09570 [Rhodococcus olei]|uniref:DUF732 domain-containing protein n=1 Tax=Rhodococcus olei TaxID=2161675 RepID=A0ABP8NV05_9NOCA
MTEAKKCARCGHAWAIARHELCGQCESRQRAADACKAREQAAVLAAGVNVTSRTGVKPWRLPLAIAAVAGVVLVVTVVVSGGSDSGDPSVVADPTMTEVFTTTETPDPYLVESDPTFTDAEIRSVAAESAYIATLDEEGVPYNSRSRVIELGRTACESLTIAMSQGVDRRTAQLLLADQYQQASDGYSLQQTLTLVAAASGAFCAR